MKIRKDAAHDNTKPHSTDKMIASGLYITDATRISLGYYDHFDITWIPNRAALNEPQILRSAVLNDEFGDARVRAEISYSAADAVPLKRLRYRNRSGDTGFENYASSSRGGPDSELRPFLVSFLEDAWTWSASAGRFIRFDEWISSSREPELFLHQHARNAARIVLHSPTREALSALTQPNTVQAQCADADLSFSDLVGTPQQPRGIDALARFLAVAADCRMVSSWKAAYGDNPVIAMSRPSSELQWIRNLCETHHVPLHFVPDENALPNW